MEPGPSSAFSPRKRNRKGKYVLSGQKQVIINLYKQIKEQSPDITYVKMINSLSEDTGIGKNTIKKTIAEYKNSGTVRSPNKKRNRLNIIKSTADEHILGIRKKVYEFWIRREIPNLDKVLEVINADAELPSFSRTTLHRLLKRMEFRFMRCKRNSALIDKEYIVAWRQNYINSIRKYRAEGRSIYYLDETWYSAGDCVRKLWVDTTVSCPRNAEERQLSTGIPAPAGKGKRLIIAHVGSKDGFLPGALLYFDAQKNSGDYHSEMNGDTFLEWFEKFLPTLREGSVIVMDNAPYHSVQKEKYPTISWRKETIIEWLHGKGETMQPDDFVKPKLLEIAKKYKPAAKNNVVDNYAKEHGHIVLRIPPYHCELNPIELAWAKIKDFIRKRNTTCKLADVRQLVDQAVENVSAENWQNFIRHTIEEENRYHIIDRAVDSVLDDHGEWVATSDDSDIDV